jgi:hypothetical protein
VQGASPLLTPTLADHVPRDWSAALPWRLGSQVYVAILGGPLALTLIAGMNAHRLRMPGRLVALVVGLGLAVFAAAIAISSAIGDADVARLVRQLSGAAAFGLVYLVQRPYDNVHRVFSPNEDGEDDYDSLWGPGIAAVVGGVILDAMIVSEVVG